MQKTVVTGARGGPISGIIVRARQDRRRRRSKAPRALMNQGAYRAFCLYLIRYNVYRSLNLKSCINFIRRGAVLAVGCWPSAGTA